MNVEFFDKKPAYIEEFTRNEFADHSHKKIGDKRKPFTCAIKDKANILAVGQGSCFGNECYISDIIVSKNHRNKGFGTKILKEIEKLAVKENCLSIYVDSYEYQAPDFYTKHKYKEIGRIENYRKGFPRIFFKKEIKI